MSTRRWLPTAAVFYGALSLVAIAWIAFRGGRAELVRRVAGTDPVRDLVIGAATGIVLLLLAAFAGAVSAALRRLDASLRRLLGPISIPVAIGLAILSGIGEELLFRAALQPEVGIVAATLLFALVHVPVERDLAPWPLLAAIAGAVFGGLYAWTGAVLAPAAAHAIVNAVGLARLGVAPRSSADGRADS